MKKSRFITLCISFVLCAFCLLSVGCAKTFNLADHVSELRSDIFLGQSENYQLKAFYGFKEVSPYIDGEVKEKENILTFRLLNKETDGATYSVKFNFSEKDYSSDFTADPVAGFLTAKFEIDDFSVKSFTAKISCAGKEQTVELKSILPENTLDYKSALNKLYQTHQTLVNAYMDENEKFTAEICMRIIVKDNKPYWYVGFTSKNDKLKALLIDGLTGEVLAIREIF